MSRSLNIPAGIWDFIGCLLTIWNHRRRTPADMETGWKWPIRSRTHLSYVEHGFGGFGTRAKGIGSRRIGKGGGLGLKRTGVHLR